MATIQPLDEKVVKAFYRKNNSGYDGISWLGAEQRFISPLRNCNLNNIEEQLLIGEDIYTDEYINENGDQIIIKHFCHIPLTDDPSSTANYYKLKTTIYSSSSIQKAFEFKQITEDGKTFTSFITSDEEGFFGDDPTTEDINTLFYLHDGVVSFGEDETENESTLIINPSGYDNIKKEELYFVKSDHTETLIITKTIGIKTYVDSNNIIHKVTHEYLDNRL